MSAPLTYESTLATSPALALHRQVFVVVRDKILSGEWPAGSAIPAEEALREQFGVSRVTVRRALADLAANGLVERRHGLGTFVAHRAAAPRPDPTQSLLDGLAKSAAETQVEVIEVRRVPAPPLVAKLLKIAANEQAHHSLRLRRIGTVPVMLTDVWVPGDLGHKITAAALKKRAMYELLQSQGVTFGRVIQTTSATAADPRRARMLEVEIGAPLITLTRLIHDLSERPVQYITAYLSPERSRVVSEIPGEQMNTLAGGQFFHYGIGDVLTLDRQ
jgi:GntR family transcriptional regulator